MQVEELWAAGPQSGVAGGLWPRQGPGTHWGTSLDSVAQHGQAEECGTCACSARAAAAPVLAPLALLVSILHTQAAERDPQLLSRTGPVGVFSIEQLEQAMPGRRLYCSHSPSSPTSLVQFLPPPLHVLCSTPCRSHGWLLGIVVSWRRPAAPEDTVLNTLGLHPHYWLDFRAGVRESQRIRAWFSCTVCWA